MISLYTGKNDSQKMLRVRFFQLMEWTDFLPKSEHGSGSVT
jgi:hypothetical protein